MTIDQRIKEMADYMDVADGQRQVLGLSKTEQIAQIYSMKRLEVEKAALRNQIFPARYERNFGTLGYAGQLALLEATVAVVGLGGLGGLTAELLARSGVGHLLLIDPDVYDETNLNRQIHSREDNLGSRKSESTRQRIRTINQSVAVTIMNQRNDQKSPTDWLSSCQVAVDCLDSLPSRFALEDKCHTVNIPMVHGAIAGLMGQVAVMEADGACLKDLYPSGQGVTDRGIETFTGNLGSTAALVASLQATEVIKLISGVGQPLKDEAFFINLVTVEAYKVRLKTS